jgi:hypothetical protein
LMKLLAHSSESGCSGGWHNYFFTSTAMIMNNCSVPWSADSHPEWPLPIGPDSESQPHLQPRLFALGLSLIICGPL